MTAKLNPSFGPNGIWVALKLSRLSQKDVHTGLVWIQKDEGELINILVARQLEAAEACLLCLVIGLILHICGLIEAPHGFRDNCDNIQRLYGCFCGCV